MKTKATKFLTTTSLLILLIFLSSCSKQESLSNNTEYRLTKITSHYFGGFADTTDYYTVSYDGNNVSKLIGKRNNVFNITFPNQIGFNRRASTLLDSCVYDNEGANLLWAVRYLNSTAYNLAQIQYPTGNTGVITYKYQSTPANQARVTYNSDKDIASISYFNGPSDTLLFTINISYSDISNKLNQAYKSFTLIDPFSTEYGIDKNTGRGFPVNIHYGKKCISSFDIVNKDGSHQLRHVSYQFNNGGHITKILIDNKPFMSYDYAPQ